jgi:hypothetical protein
MGAKSFYSFDLHADLQANVDIDNDHIRGEYCYCNTRRRPFRKGSVAKQKLIGYSPIDISASEAAERVRPCLSNHK